MNHHPALAAANAAIITGAASGIGLAAAKRFAGSGMPNAGDVVAIPTDVANFEAVQALRDRAYQRFRTVSVLMNNAGVGRGGGAFDDISAWRKVIGPNLWGVIHGMDVLE